MMRRLCNSWGFEDVGPSGKDVAGFLFRGCLAGFLKVGVASDLVNVLMASNSVSRPLGFRDFVSVLKQGSSDAWDSSGRRVEEERINPYTGAFGS